MELWAGVLIFSGILSRWLSRKSSSNFVVLVQWQINIFYSILPFFFKCAVFYLYVYSELDTSRINSKVKHSWFVWVTHSSLSCTWHTLLSSLYIWIVRLYTFILIFETNIWFCVSSQELKTQQSACSLLMSTHPELKNLSSQILMEQSK